MVQMAVNNSIQAVGCSCGKRWALDSTAAGQHRKANRLYYKLQNAGEQPYAFGVRLEWPAPTQGHRH